MNKTTLSSFLYGSLLFLGPSVVAQSDSLWKRQPELKLSAFVDVFYCYDLNQPQTNSRQSFLYNHNRHNEFNLNLGFVKAALVHEKYRANLALQTGTYVHDNYMEEQVPLNTLLEGNAGLALNRKNNLWLDAGIFASHIGFESAVSSDNWTLTRSILAEHSPYFLSGAKLTFTPNEKWELAALVLNGWQRIQRLPGNSLLSGGTQVKFKPSEKIVLNWSTFIGTDDPDSMRRMRYFNNYYGQFELTKKLGLIAGIDFGFQQTAKQSENYAIWFGSALILRYAFSDKWAAAFRAEYFQDRSGVKIPTGSPIGFSASGISLNLDYSPVSNVLCRIEGRWLNNQDPFFARDNVLVRDNAIVLASIALRIAN